MSVQTQPVLTQPARVAIGDLPVRGDGLGESLVMAIALLVHYFDLAPTAARLLSKKWAQLANPHWVRLAVIEALYQGRYKPISVEQLLLMWRRRDKATCHFNTEFERLVAVPLEKEARAWLVNLGEPILDPQQLPKRPATATSVAERLLLLPAGSEDAPVDAPVDELAAEAGAIVPFGTLAEAVAIEPAEDGLAMSPAVERPVRSRSVQMHQPPINQFTPVCEPSEFFARLKEVAEQADYTS